MCAKIKQNALYNFTHDFNNNNIQSILSLILQPAYGLFDCEKLPHCKLPVLNLPHKADFIEMKV